MASKLKDYKNKKDVVILGIARGGVVVAKKISDKLNLPLGIVVIKKVGAPRNPELAIGAVGPKNTVYWRKNLLEEFRISKDELLELKFQKQTEQREQEEKLQGNKPSIELKDKDVIVIDDGAATGADALCAYLLLKKEARKIILAVPVISKDAFNNVNNYFDIVIALKIESNFHSVSQFYLDFPQVENEDVLRIIS